MSHRVTHATGKRNSGDSGGIIEILSIITDASASRNSSDISHA